MIGVAGSPGAVSYSGAVHAASHKPNHARLASDHGADRRAPSQHPAAKHPAIKHAPARHAPAPKHKQVARHQTASHHPAVHHAAVHHAAAHRLSHAHSVLPTKPYLIYDSTTPSAIPAHRNAAAYATGNYAASPGQMTGRHQVLWIDTTGYDPHASVLDVEPGDATPALAANWAKNRLAADPHAVARLYTFRNEWPAVQAAVARPAAPDAVPHPLVDRRPDRCAAHRSRFVRHPVVLGLQLRHHHSRSPLLMVLLDGASPAPSPRPAAAEVPFPDPAAAGTNFRSRRTRTIFRFPGTTRSWPYTTWLCGSFASSWPGAGCLVTWPGAASIAASSEQWQAGYAPPGWDTLTRHLRAAHYPDSLIEAAGLARRIATRAAPRYVQGPGRAADPGRPRRRRRVHRPGCSARRAGRAQVPEQPDDPAVRQAGRAVWPVGGPHRPWPPGQLR